MHLARLAMLALAILAGPLAGCAVRTGASGSRDPGGAVPLAIDAAGWPARGAEGEAFGHVPPHPLISLVHLGRYGEGDLYDVALRGRSVRGAPREGRPRPRGLLFASIPADADGAAPRRRTFTLRVVGEEAPPMEVGAAGSVTTISIHEPVANPRGVALFLSSYVGVSVSEERLIGRLAERGWVTIVCTPPADVYQGAAFAMREGTLGSAARAVARMADDHIAERVYAAHAALRWLEEERPELRGTPLVLVGCSAGAVATPALALRLGDRVSAAVLVGGGANLPRLVLTSPLLRDRVLVFAVSGRPGERDVVQVRGPSGRSRMAAAAAGAMAGLYLQGPGNAHGMRVRTLGGGERGELAEAALRESRLDPAHTAAALARVPVLMVHAMYDQIVPDPCTRLLYERLGRPERWSYPVGHLGLFYLLRFKTSEIADWLDRAVAPPGRGRRDRAVRGLD